MADLDTPDEIAAMMAEAAQVDALFERFGRLLATQRQKPAQPAPAEDVQAPHPG